MKLNEKQLEELKKCESDIEYFIENYCKCSKNGLYELIELSEEQKHILKPIIDSRVFVYEKERQIGGTTLLIGYLLHYIIFHSFEAVGIFSPNLNMKTEMNQKIRIAIDMLPDWIKPKTLISNKDLIKLENGNVIKFLSIKSQNLRGTSFSLCIFDEPALDYNFDEEFILIWRCSLVANEQSKSIFISTEPEKVMYWDRFVKNYYKGKYK
jgi:hypothetical protein